MTPKQSTRSERKLNKLKENKLEELAKKLDLDIRGYDHIVDYADNHTASLRSDWVDENIRTIIMKHNYNVNKVSKMLIRDFNKKNRRQQKMRSNNFPDKEILAMTPNMEGVTRPEKDKKTKNLLLLLKELESELHL